MLLNRKATRAFILMIAQDKDTRMKKWSRVSPESLDAAEAALKNWIHSRTNPQNLPKVGKTVKL
jgi:hypothetical protein